MFLNLLFDMPHLSGGCIILAKEKYSLTGMLTNFFTKFQRNKHFALKDLWDLLSAQENTLHVTSYIFDQYIYSLETQSGSQRTVES
jgi:hypothetical protein